LGVAFQFPHILITNDDLLFEMFQSLALKRGSVNNVWLSVNADPRLMRRRKSALRLDH
jgi:hypothetical protein